MPLRWHELPGKDEARSNAAVYVVQRILQFTDDCLAKDSQSPPGKKVGDRPRLIGGCTPLGTPDDLQPLRITKSPRSRGLFFRRQLDRVLDGLD
jgi:hypothetical protein